MIVMKKSVFARKKLNENKKNICKYLYLMFILFQISIKAIEVITWVL